MEKTSKLLDLFQQLRNHLERMISCFFLFPQFIDFNSNYIVQFFILITTYIVLDFLSLIGYALLAQKLILWIKANPKTINTISASVLVIIALIIIVTQQY